MRKLAFVAAVLSALATNAFAQSLPIPQPIPQPIPRPIPRPIPQPIPHGGIALGDADIARAWLAEPTQRYAHGVLGDRVEANAIIVETQDGARKAFRLNDTSVFEHLTPMLADIDGDGRDEAWVVRSDATDGARLEAYALEDGKLIRRYAGPAIGRGFRWLNPIGIGDFDGDGKREAAYIETPHIGGILTILKPNGARLDITARAVTAYSTHSIGSTSLDLAAIADIDGDGRDDIILPNQVHDRLIVVSLKGRTLVERWRSNPVAPVGGHLRLERSEKGWTASYVSKAHAAARVTIPTAALSPLR